MAGLLQYLQQIKDGAPTFDPTPGSMGLMQAGAQMLANSGPSMTPQNFGSALGQGLGGFSSGFMGMQDMRRKQEKEANDLALQQAQIDHYKALNNKTMQGADPYYQVMETSNGLYKFDARSGNYEPIMAGNKPLMRSTSDPYQQGAITKAKEGEKIDKQTLPTGAIVPMRNNDALNVSRGNANFQLSPDASPEDRAAMEALVKSYGNNAGIGQTTEQKNAQEALGKATAENQIGLNQKISALDAVIKEAQDGITALNPKVDPLINKVVGFNFETGGMLPGAREFWSKSVVNDPAYRQLETSAAGANLQNAVKLLHGQGAVTEGERALVGMATGIDPYTQTSEKNYDRLTRIVQAAEKAKQDAIKAAGGNYGAQPNRPSNLPRGAKFLGFE
jgi:hypothetical protein